MVLDHYLNTLLNVMNLMADATAGGYLSIGSSNTNLHIDEPIE